MTVRDHSLEAGQALALRLEAGAEVFCAGGALRLQGLGLATPMQLATGQGWRADQTVQLQVEALQASRCRVVARSVVPPADVGRVLAPFVRVSPRRA